MSNENQEYLDSLRDAMQYVTVDNLVTLLLESNEVLKQKSPNVHDLVLAFLDNQHVLEQATKRIEDLESQVTNYESIITSYGLVINDHQSKMSEQCTIIKNLRQELHGVYQDRKRLEYQIAKLTH